MGEGGIGRRNERHDMCQCLPYIVEHKPGYNWYMYHIKAFGIAFVDR